MSYRAKVVDVDFTSINASVPADEPKYAELPDLPIAKVPNAAVVLANCSVIVGG